MGYSTQTWKTTLIQPKLTFIIFSTKGLNGWRLWRMTWEGRTFKIVHMTQTVNCRSYTPT